MTINLVQVHNFEAMMDRTMIEIPLFFVLLIGVVLASVLIAKLPVSRFTGKEVPLVALQAKMGLSAINGGLFFLLLLFWATLFLLLFGGLVGTIYATLTDPIPTRDDDKAIWNWRFSILKLASLTAVLGAVVALPISLVRIGLTRAQNATAEQGLITDRMNKAIEGLGVEKQVFKLGRDISYTSDQELVRAFEFQDEPADIPVSATDLQRTPWQNFSVNEPVLEVRLGAIYALERIAKDSMRDHVEIVEILCAYIRHNAPCKELIPEHLPETRAIPRIDIQAAITVISRRSAEGIKLEHAGRKRLNLNNCDLSGVYFDEGNFLGASFLRTKLESAILDRANMRGSLLIASNLRYATFWDTDLTGARLDRAIVSPSNRFASLNRAVLLGVCFFGTDMRNVFMKSAFKKYPTIGNKDTFFDGHTETQMQEMLSLLERRNFTEDEGVAPEDMGAFKHFWHWSPFSDDDGANGSILSDAKTKLGLTGWPFD